MAQLTLRENGTESVVPLPAERATIGRADHNDVRVRDPRASKEHCQLVEVGGRWKLVDLESHNGTRVNGRYRNKAWLDEGDAIAIGQSELRFSNPGSSRGAPAAARTAGTGDFPADEREPLPRRYDPGGGGEKLLIYGGALLGVVLVFLIVSQVASKLAPDPHNVFVLEEARKLEAIGQWEDARRYLEDHADPDGNLYARVLERIRYLEELRPDLERAVREREAHQLLSRMANKIANYDRGGSAEPAEILRMMQQLKTDYAGTRQDLDAAKTYPEWYSGVVPDPARDRKNPVEPTEESIEYGKLLFSSQCVMCHGKQGAGDGDLVARFSYEVPDFTDPGLQKQRTDGELFYILHHGHGKMPDQGDRFDEKVLWDLVNYLRTLSRQPT